MAGLAKAAKAKGLKTEGLWVDAQAFQRTRLPALAWVNGNHWVAVLEVGGNKVTPLHPAKEQKETTVILSAAKNLAFQQQWAVALLRVWKPK